MQFLTQTVFAWLLMFAIPVQGFAATAMLFCAPSHHGGVVVSTVTQADALTLKTTEYTAHHHVGMAQSSHHENESDVSSSVSSDVDDSFGLNKAVQLKVGKLGDGKCSACATCCTVSALVGTPIMNPVATIGSDSIPFTLESFASYVPEGSDPPPRSIFA